MSQFAQATLYGLLQGGLLALVAVGFSLVWGVMNVVNLAHGAFVLCGAYVALELNRALGLDPFLAMVPAALVLFGLGYAVQRGLINLIVNGPLLLEVSCAAEPSAKADAAVRTSCSGPVTTFGRLPLNLALVVALGGSSESVSTWIA